jgi:hypothetical protein
MEGLLQKHSKRMVSPLHPHSLQCNVTKIEGNLQTLEQRLVHERAKQQQYEEGLQQHEQRWGG